MHPHVLITAGPTREYLDDVRFLSNASSGRMGYALAEAAIRLDWNVTIVSGPVSIAPPPHAQIRSVTSAQQMLDVCLELFPAADGLIAVAAVADYRPKQRWPGKVHRNDDSIQLELIPNPDILAELGRRKSHQWTVGFAVEVQDHLVRGRTKLQKKNCDAIVVNHASAIEAPDTHIQLLDRSGTVALDVRGPKSHAAEQVIQWIARHLIVR